MANELTGTRLYAFEAQGLDSLSKEWVDVENWSKISGDLTKVSTNFLRLRCNFGMLDQSKLYKFRLIYNGVAMPERLVSFPFLPQGEMETNYAKTAGGWPELQVAEQ